MFDCLKYFLEFNLPTVLFSFLHVPSEVLDNDFNKISNEELLKFCEENEENLTNLLSSVNKEDILITLKKYFILCELEESIPKIRLNALLNTNKPYDSGDLEGLKVDKDGLVNLQDYLN